MYRSALPAIAVACILLSFLYCSKPLLKTTPEWEQWHGECPVIAIKFFPDDPYISDQDIVGTFFGISDTKEKFRRFVHSSIRELVFRRSSCKRIVMLEDSITLNETSLTIRKDIRRSFHVPADSLPDLVRRGITFLLLIEKYAVTFSKVYYDPAENAVQNSLFIQKKAIHPELFEKKMPVKSNMRQSLKFVAVHCASGKIVQYGELTDEETYSHLNRDDFFEPIEEFMKDIFDKGPFSAKNDSYINENQ
ncbi:MAG: hypothetical protein JW863_12365 [Chitinispirillaceae bacterium]|nr:hypothetical protein [Chitinispirillaceae bacterium]